MTLCRPRRIYVFLQLFDQILEFAFSESVLQREDWPVRAMGLDRSLQVLEVGQQSVLPAVQGHKDSKETKHYTATVKDGGP
jgi:hypothetical protein